MGEMARTIVCGALLRELEQIWREIGEKEEDKERMLMELEMECMRVYRKKLDDSSKERARLHQSLLASEAELSALAADLGESTLPATKTNKKQDSLREQLATVKPLVDELRVTKEERIRQFAEIKSQIEKIKAEIAGPAQQCNGLDKQENDDHDLSIRRLEEYQTQLNILQKEKTERLNKVTEYVNEIHCLSSVLGFNFAIMLGGVHPSLRELFFEKSTNISDETIEGLNQAIKNLKTEKKARLHKLWGTVETLFKLWTLMESSEEERGRFAKVASVIGSLEEEIVSPGLLSLETIKQTEEEVERLKKVKAGRMKEIVLKRRSELEEICKNAHTEPDISTAPDKCIALIDSGIVDPSEILENLESQILKAKEECMSRKEIMDRVAKWVAVCDEENWLEEYNRDQNRYSAGRGAHLNLRRAEKARMIVAKIPAIVDNLMSKTFAWEDARNKPFLYDGVRLVAVLEEYKLTRQQKEDEKRRYRDQRKLQNLLVTERDLLYNSKPNPRKPNSLRKTIGYGPGINLTASGFMTPASGRISAATGGATPELLSPRSYSGRSSSYFSGGTRQLSSRQLKFGIGSKADSSMSSFASIISESESNSPFLH